MVTGPPSPLASEPEPLLLQAAMETARAATRAEAAMPRRMETPRKVGVPEMEEDGA
ncbi:hypothetical protein Kpho02_59130 [Kitasatospora phosalacinea]|uniref:Uncharacterized protein n=1 Tax=Kitasatospora phosalacinea TaxID=2065 RepID=A0A9W6QEK8_9ACTN|nr:hypothetical protein Kpho02_59130 [Kitasatospora phosalacinea]